MRTDRAKNLKRIEKLLSENKDTYFNKTDLRDILKIDYYALLDWLSYLFERKKVIIKDIGGSIKYKWREE